MEKEATAFGVRALATALVVNSLLRAFRGD
jgi:hypothetical protein